MPVGFGGDIKTVHEPVIDLCRAVEKPWLGCRRDHNLIRIAGFGQHSVRGPTQKVDSVPMMGIALTTRPSGSVRLKTVQSF